MNLSKIPKHIWLGIALPLVLVGFGIWRWWPEFEEHWKADERMAAINLNFWGWDDEPRLNSKGRMTYRTSEAYGYVFTPIERNDSSVTCGQFCPEETTRCSHVVQQLTIGYCAYPAEHDWRHKHTLIKGISDQIYGIDNGGMKISEWPTDEELADRFIKVSIYKPERSLEDVLEEYENKYHD